jgi:hypothetical protein
MVSLWFWILDFGIWIATCADGSGAKGHSKSSAESLEISWGVFLSCSGCH